MAESPLFHRISGVSNSYAVLVVQFLLSTGREVKRRPSYRSVSRFLALRSGPLNVYESMCPVEPPVQMFFGGGMPGGRGGMGGMPGGIPPGLFAAMGGASNKCHSMMHHRR